MFRTTLVLVLGLCTSSAASAASWADGMFEELSKDFGSVPRGPTLSHPFRLTNNTSSPVHIAGLRVSCGCTSATALRADLAPGESTTIVAQMDTRKFAGVKAVTIFVQFDQPRWEEVRLWVQANSRDDMLITPDSLAFGNVRRGARAVATVDISFLGYGQWQITDARCDSNYVLTTVQELQRADSEVSYRLTARVRADTPVGRWYTDVWVTTNNPAMPRVRVPLTVEVEAPLTLSPAGVVLGQVKAGAAAERKVILRGAKPFRVTRVLGTDDLLAVRDSTTESKAVHVLTVTVHTPRAGEFNRPINVSRTLRVFTDLGEGGYIDFEAKARILP
jgi:hypothetical protein